ncbi:MAG TPA: alpha/beta hydrolase [Chloroflexia bacterium]|nr:alpha/beta hydrolase [Chloroflexia bacterium]
MPYLKINGWPLFYERRGSALPQGSLVIFFNGWLLSSRYWAETAARLEKDCQLLLFDGRGFGRSSLRQSPEARSYHATIENSAREAFDLLQALNLDQGWKYHVVGHSLGAVSAAHFAAQAEQRGQLASLTIVNSGSFESTEPQGIGLDTFVRYFVKLKWLFDLPLVRQLVVSRSVTLPISSSYARIITEDFVLADERLALEMSLSSLDSANLQRYREELEQLRAPLLLVVGDRDPTIPPRGMYTIKGFKPSAELVSFPDCGHLPMLERPADFAQALMRSIARSQVTI